MVSTTEFLRATSMRIGSRRKRLVSFWISGAMVAEKNSVWRRGGSLAQIFSISGMKPMSSMRSASSMTRISTPLIRMRPRSNWSSRRPGVAISTSTPRSSFLFWSSNDDAADDQRHRELVVLAVFLEILVHLRGEFARRFEDQRARHAGAGAAAFEQRQHRQHERRGLAGAGLRNADDVLLLQDMRDGLRLDFGGLGVAGGGNRVGHLGAEAEPGKVFWQCVRPLRGWEEPALRPGEAERRSGSRRAGNIEGIPCKSTGFPRVCLMWECDGQMSRSVTNCGVFLDELEARFGLGAHQPVDRGSWSRRDPAAP